MSSSTCEIDGPNGIDMVVDIGGVRPPFTPIWTGKLGPGPLQPDSQPVSVLPHKAGYQVDGVMGKGCGAVAEHGRVKSGKGWRGVGHSMTGTGGALSALPDMAGCRIDVIARGQAGRGGGGLMTRYRGCSFFPHTKSRFDVIVRVWEGGGGCRGGWWGRVGDLEGGERLKSGRGVQSRRH